MKTKIEIINETVEYYGADPVGRRAYNEGGGCEYHLEDGRMCAVGRCMIDAEEAQEKRFGSVLGIRLLDSLLQEDYRGHSLEFWSRVQTLHDYMSYWDNHGLTGIGLAYAADLRARYAELAEA